MSSGPQVYTVLARRYRPQRFEDVVGQEHVVRALQNAIRENRVAHAYLFTGARGVGKTSTARILAKALNCPHAVDGVPCNECDICRSISAGHDMDVLEIDGASNRGIDDIRRIRSGVNVKSMRTKYRVYIIDEVHMLTTEAFNALLKTLEEPPPNVKFVFCTTEPQKVPETILSRCQRFDFGTIPADRIATRLKEIAEREGKRVEDAAIELVARRAAGSLRDSQSLFDQLLAFGGEEITAADVHRLLGTAPEDQLLQLGGALVAGRCDAAIESLERILAEGVQLSELMDQLLDYTRDLMVLSTGADDVPLQSVSEAARQRLSEQAGRLGVSGALAAMQILSDARQKMQRSVVGRAIAEMALVRVCLLKDLQPLAEVIGRVQQGESPVPLRLQPAASDAPPPAGGPEKKTEPAVIDASLDAATPSGQSPSAEARQDVGTTRPAGTTPREFAERPTAQAVRSAPKIGDVSQTPTDGSRAGDTPATTKAGRSERPDRPPLRGRTPGSGAVDRPVPSTSGQAAAHEPASDQPRQAGDTPAPGDVWEAVLARFEGLPAQHLRAATRAAWAGDDVWELTFPGTHRLSADFCQRPETRAELSKALEAVTGRRARIRVTIDTNAVADDKRPDRAELHRLVVTAVDNDPLVSAAVKYLEARVMDVRDLGPLTNTDDEDDGPDEAPSERGDTDEDQ